MAHEPPTGPATGRASRAGFAYQDLLGEGGEDYSRYFDPAEFRAREELEDTHYWHRHRRQLVLELLSAADPPPRRAIELGCGTGNVATHLNRHGIHVDYADVHAEGLEIARRRAERALRPSPEAPLRFVRLDVLHHFPDGPYDCVLLLDVLEHLPEPERVLTLARSRLEPGALLLFTVPAFSFLWSPWDDLQRHQRRYTRAGARALAEGAGFAIERLTYFFLPLFFGACAVKGLRAVADRVRPPRPDAAFTELMEAQSPRWLEAPVDVALGLERRWLRARSLPFGTSLLCMARAR